MLGFTVLSVVGAAATALYFYVGVAAYKASAMSGGGFVRNVLKAAVWPATIWKTIDALYNVRPR